MGRERQKKKNRSSVSKVKPTLRGRTKYGRKKVNFLGNAVVAENWYFYPLLPLVRYRIDSNLWIGIVIRPSFKTTKDLV